MKKNVLFLLSIMFSLNVFAQNPGPPNPSPGRPPFQPPGPPPNKPPKGKSNQSDHKNGMAFYSVTPLLDETEGESKSSSIMTPNAWTSSRPFAFVGLAGTPNQVYSDGADAFGQVGIGAGDSRKWVSVVGILNVVDMSKLANYSLDIIASRNVDKYSSISIGGMHLFSDPDKVDAGPSYYVAYSRAIENSDVNFTVGAGSGRFLEMSPSDQKIGGKGAYGTGIFANVSYKVQKNISVSAEWTGLNLCLSTSAQIKGSWPVISFGVADITRFSGDTPTLHLSVGHPIFINSKRK